MSCTQHDEITPAVADVLVPFLDTGSAGAGPPPPSTADVSADNALPCISIRCKRLPETVSAAVQAMITYNNPPVLFEHGGELVKLTIPNGDRPRLAPLRSIDLQRELAYAARWYEETDKGARPIYPPSLVVNAVAARLREWAPPLRQVVGVPTFGTDWQLLDIPGYHPADQTYYHPDHAPLPPVSAHPDAHAVVEAVRLIRDELLGDFPFASPADRAAAIACLLTPFVRDRIDGATPLHLLESPTPGSGKTLLADVLCLPALGKAAAATTEIASADDLRKSITALALAGEPVVLIDNINARLQGSALAAALTKVEWADRIVGSSRLARGAMKAVWIGTGNNVVMTRELARRVVRSRIDPGVPQPHLRTGFRHADLRAWTKAHRPCLIWAALTLVQNWVARGTPSGTGTLGSFESYCRIIGGILAAADVPGFLSNVPADQAHADDETVEWEVFVAAWRQLLGDKIVGAESLDTELLTPNPEMLSTTLATTGSERGRRIKLGQELRKRRDSVIGGFRVTVSERPDRHGRWRYRLMAVVQNSSAMATLNSDATEVEDTDD